jgi:transcriptional regulator with XRE-family HTH domain
MKTFSEKLRDARENLDMSQAKLAEKAGISQRSVTAYENENIIPRGNTLKKARKSPWCFCWLSDKR